MELVIQNVKVADKNSPFHGKTVSLRIVGAQITEIAEGPLAPGNSRVFDATGLQVSPGWTDGATHFKDPGYEWLDDLASLSEAAAYGGFTKVLGFPNTQPVVQTKEAISYFTRFNTQSAVQLLNLAAVTRDCKGDDFTDMIDLKTGGATGFSDGKEAIQNSDIFLKTLQYLEPLDTVLVVKSEDRYLSMYGQMHEGLTSTLLGMKGIPAAGEELMIMRNLKLLEYSGVRSEKPILHFSTISTQGSVELIREAKKKGLPVSCDIAAHHLVFTEEDLMGFDTNLKVYPPFRSGEDIAALKAGLEDGTIDMIVSDHNSWDEEHKTLEFDAAEFGAIGLQTVFPVGLEALGLEQTLEKLVYKPAEIFRLKAGRIEKDQPADLTVFSDREEYDFTEGIIRSKGKNSPFTGRKLKGRAKAVVNNGIFKQLD
ncbi:MAG: dihydroorotase [Leadbetterella sp.]|nr:dihydroorotase [Leadbetterella sp.]